MQSQHFDHFSPKGAAEYATPEPPTGHTLGRTALKRFTMSFAQNASSLQSDSAYGVVAVAARVREVLARRAVFRKTVSELKQLNGRELADLGLNRSMITRTAYEAAYGK